MIIKYSLSLWITNFHPDKLSSSDLIINPKNIIHKSKTEGLKADEIYYENRG